MFELSSNSAASRQEMNRADEHLLMAEAAVDAAGAGVEKAHAATVVHQAALRKAEAQLAAAEWRLARTHLEAPADGTINAHASPASR